MLTVHPVNANLKVQLGSSAPAVSNEVLARVEEIWKSENARRGDGLFNGQLFSIEHSRPDRITGWFAEYRWFLAQRTLVFGSSCRPAVSTAPEWMRLDSPILVHIFLLSWKRKPASKQQRFPRPPKRSSWWKTN
jgi:hypothetical protein